jgi:hypothetical protein
MIENMSFNDLGLLLKVIEIRVVQYILIHGLRFLMLQCDIFALKDRRRRSEGVNGSQSKFLK